MPQSRLEFAKVLAKKTLHIEDEPLLAQEIAAYLIEHNEPYDLHSVMRDVIANRAELGIVEATVFSAHPVSDAVRQDVKALVAQQFPTSKRITINERIQPNLVGGVRVQLPGKELDLSISARLNTFKQFVSEGRN